MKTSLSIIVASFSILLFGGCGKAPTAPAVAQATPEPSTPSVKPKNQPALKDQAAEATPSQATNTPSKSKEQQLTSSSAQEYREVVKDDGLSCHFTQDISSSLNSPSGGTMSATVNHFKCDNKSGEQIEIELISTDPSKSAGLENGKVAIRTKDFGTVYRGNKKGAFGVFYMTDSQIAKLKASLGL